MGGYSQLTVTPYRPEDPTEQMVRAMQLSDLVRNAPLRRQLLQQQVQTGQMQQQQMQMAIQDQQKLRSIMSQYDNWDDVMSAASRAGVSPQMLMGLQQQRNENRLKAVQADEGQHKLDMDHNDWVVGQLDYLKLLPEDKRQALLPAIQSQHATLFPHYASQFPQQVPTDDQSLQALRNLFTAHSTDVSDAKTAAETQEKAALTAKTEAETKYYQDMGLAPGASDTDKWVMSQLQARGLENTPSNQAKLRNEYIELTKLKPAQLRAQIMLNRPYEVLDPNNPGQTIMVPGTQAYGMPGKGSVSQSTLSSQAKKAQPQFVAFDTADQHLQLIEQAGDALRNGNIQGLNQIANWYGVQIGQDPVTTFKALTTVAAPEIVRASAGSGQMSEREIEVARNNFNPKLSPQQITSNVKAMRGLMAGKRAALQKNLESLQGGNVTGGGGRLPQGNGRAIDKATAQQFYQAAGGDPVRARQLAQQNGWQVK